MQAAGLLSSTGQDGKSLGRNHLSPLPSTHVEALTLVKPKCTRAGWQGGVAPNLGNALTQAHSNKINKGAQATAVHGWGCALGRGPSIDTGIRSGLS